MTDRPDAEPARLRRLTLATIGGGLLIRVIVAALAPLLPDEAYYWEWSRHLAGGYFDHPPAVAWLIAAGTALLGATPLGIRLGTLVVGTGAIGAAVAIARRLGGERAALWAALLLLCMPLATIGLTIATTDAPALLAIASALLCIVIAIEAPPGSAASTRWWLAAGFAFGLGLLSKLTVGIAGVAVAVALLLRPSLRAQLRTAGPWLAVLLAAVVATPFLLWNSHHGWISFRFQLTHGLGAPKRGSAIGRELSLVGSQMGLVSPGIFLLAAAAAWAGLRRRANVCRDEARDACFFLAAVGTAMFAFFVYSALRRPVEANWPAPAFIALVPLAAASSGLTILRWRAPAAALGGALVLVALVQLATPVLPLPARRDPVARAYGWTTLAAAADSMRHATPTPSGRTVWLGADRYQDAAEIALLAPGHPPVFALNLGGRPNQYDLWPSFAASARAGDALIAAIDTGTAEGDVARKLGPHFTAAAPGRRVALMRNGDTVAVRRLWTFSGWRGSWPATSPGGR